MNGVAWAITHLHHGENDLVDELLQIAERHRSEHEVHHVCRNLAAWSAEHVTLLAKQATSYGLNLDEEADRPSSLANRLRSLTSTAIGRSSETGMLLLEDLTRIYLMASDNSLSWEMLGQVAQAKREPELLALSERCHPQNLRQVRWANTMIKTLSPQVLCSLGA